jgi:uroporphyrinogen decarboxylase
MPAWALPEREGNRWVYRSPSGIPIAHMPDGVLYFEQIHWPFLGSPADLEDLPRALENTMWASSRCAAPPGPLVSGPEGERLLAEGAQKFRARTNRAIVGLFGGNLLEIGQFLFRNDAFFLLLAGEPDRAHEFLETLTEMHLKNLEKYLGLVGASIDIIVFGDDLGMQTGPQISPRMYREFFKPRHARLWKRAKELANVKVMLHSCGGVRELLPDLIDAGLDAINPVQITCDGMQPRGLKADFGKDITFWGGGCDTRSILPHGTPEEIRRHVREQIAILHLGGGFVFQQVHNILADIPPENILTMFDTVNSWH